MILSLFMFAMIIEDYLCSIKLYYDDDVELQPVTISRKRTKTTANFEPSIPPRLLAIETLSQDIVVKKIDCESFTAYATNCTTESALMYNSSKRSPPMPAKLSDWCKAIRHLTNCAVDWNSECMHITESHFNEESIKGHMHVVNNICDDEFYVTRYDSLPQCIDKVANSWELCYVLFRGIVEEQKNSTPEWTHYNTHFLLCCARTQFRRCTLEALFLQPESKCDHDNALLLQKFSVVVSEGDVYQDCDHNMMYNNCPGGDPRPSDHVLSKLMNGEADNPTVRSDDTKSDVSDLDVCATIFVICIPLINLIFAYARCYIEPISYLSFLKGLSITMICISK